MLGEFTDLYAVSACGAVVAAAEAVTIPLLRRAAVLDVPGHRSSHTVPTPGGGVPDRRRAARGRGPDRWAVAVVFALASGSVFYADPVTWPGKQGRPGKHGTPVTCADDPGQANPEPGESVMLTGTQRYGTVRVGSWRAVHPLIHGDRG